MNGKKWPWIFIGLVAALTAAKWIWFNVAPKEKTEMPQNASRDAEMKIIPPIDAAAPEKLETAAFAMG